MLLKSFVLLAWLAGSWASLVFATDAIWAALLLAISLGFAIAAVGMGIQHDANHGAYSRHAWVNFLFSLSLDMLGVSSFIWRAKHNVIHHTFTNIQGVDFDLDFRPLARLTVTQPWRVWHRFQHLYLWPFYGLLLPKWVLVDDFVHLFTRNTGPHALPRLRRRDIFLFCAGKLSFLTWAFVVPAFFHPLWIVLVFASIAVFVMGVTLGVIFQLAHCCDAAEFPEAPPAKRGDQAPAAEAEVEWAAHQIATTVDFARDNRFLTWFCSGLTFQVEHHLFPRICHLHYPALSRIVEVVAAKHGIRYRAHRTFFEAIASHYRLLRKLGVSPA